MKHLFFILICGYWLVSCQDDSSCLKAAGKPVEKSVLVNSFNSLQIDAGISVEIIPSNEFKVAIKSYENRINEIHIEVIEGTLKLTNEASCGIIHRYKVAEVKVYTPTLENILSKTQFEIFSNETLTYPKLHVVNSLDEKNASSVFRLNIDNEYFVIEDNQVGLFVIQGKTQKLDVHLYGGNGRIEAAHLKAYNANVFHRSNNDIGLQVENRLEGTIYATGNLVLYNKPSEVVVEQKYSGKIIYK